MTVRTRYVSDATSRASKDQTGGSRLSPEMQGQELCDSLEPRAWVPLGPGAAGTRGQGDEGARLTPRSLCIHLCCSLKTIPPSQLPSPSPRTTQTAPDSQRAVFSALSCGLETLLPRKGKSNGLENRGWGQKHKLQ